MCITSGFAPWLPSATFASFDFSAPFFSSASFLFGACLLGVVCGIGMPEICKGNGVIVPVAICSVAKPVATALLTSPVSCSTCPSVSTPFPSPFSPALPVSSLVLVASWCTPKWKSSMATLWHSGCRLNWTALPAFSHFSLPLLHWAWVWCAGRTKMICKPKRLCERAVSSERRRKSEQDWLAKQTNFAFVLSAILHFETRFLLLLRPSETIQQPCRMSDAPWLDMTCANDEHSGFLEAVMGSMWSAHASWSDQSVLLCDFLVVDDGFQSSSKVCSRRVYVYIAFSCQSKIESATDNRGRKWCGKGKMLRKQEGRWKLRDGWRNVDKDVSWCIFSIQKMKMAIRIFSSTDETSAHFWNQFGFKFCLARFHFSIVWSQNWPQIWSRFWPQKSGRFLRFSSVLWDGSCVPVPMESAGN